VTRPGYRIGVPLAGTWEEVLNTDAAAYAGSNQVNATPLATTEESAHGCAQSIELTVPPLATTFLRYKGT